MPLSLPIRLVLETPGIHWSRVATDQEQQGQELDGGVGALHGSSHYLERSLR
jgi:hypothetical protein